MQTCPNREFGASLYPPSLYSVLDTAYGGDRSTTSPWCHCKWAYDQPSPVFEESTNHRLGFCYSTVPEAKCKSQTIVHWLQRIWWRRCPAFMWSPRRCWRCHLKIVQKAFWLIFGVNKQLDRCMRFRRAESGRCKLWVQNLKYCSCYAGCHVNACHRMPIRGCSWAGRLSALQTWRWSCTSCGRFHQVQQNNSGHLDTIFAICVAVTCQELLHCNLMTRFPWSFAFFLVFHHKRNMLYPSNQNDGDFFERHQKSELYSYVIY